MGGHEGNTESIPMRCVFLVTLISTFYGFILLNDNWPKDGLNERNQANQGKPTSLKELLQSLDIYYNTEINVEHHDHDENLLCGDHDDHDEEGHEGSHEESHGTGHGGHGDHEGAAHGGGHTNAHEDHIPEAEEGNQRGDIVLNENSLNEDSEEENKDEDLTDSELEDQAQLYEEYVREMEKGDDRN